MIKYTVKIYIIDDYINKGWIIKIYSVTFGDLIISRGIFALDKKI